MPVPPHIKITFDGEFVNTGEIFTFGMKFSRGSAAPFAVSDATAQDVHLDQVEAATRTFWTQSHFSTSVRLNELNAYLIGADGKTVGNPQNRLLTGQILGSGAAGFKYPLQTSLCVTTVGANRGPARFGRFFLPQTTTTIDGLGFYDNTAIDTLLTKVVAWCKAVSDAVDIPNTTSGVAMQNISQLLGGQRQDVDHIEIGLRPDVIRSRANKQPENYRKSGHIDW